MALTAKQQRFVEEYIIDLNATQAASRAGYSEKTAYSIGQENLKKPEIADEIEKRRSKLSEKAEISAEWVLRELQDTYNKAKDVGDLSPANKSLELIGKHLGMFKDNVKLEHEGGFTINIGIPDVVESG